MAKRKTMLELNSKERRALEALLNYSYAACRNGCVYPEMQNSKKGCDNCQFVRDVDSLINKLGMYGEE